MYPNHQSLGQRQPTACQKGRYVMTLHHDIHGCQHGCVGERHGWNNHERSRVFAQVGRGLAWRRMPDMQSEDKNSELKRNSDNTSTSTIRKRSSPLHGGFSAPELIRISAEGTAGPAGGSI